MKKMFAHNPISPMVCVYFTKFMDDVLKGNGRNHRQLLIAFGTTTDFVKSLNKKIMNEHTSMLCHVESFSVLSVTLHHTELALELPLTKFLVCQKVASC